MGLSVDSNDHELSSPRASQRRSNSLDRRWPFFFGWLRREVGMRPHFVFLSSGITGQVLGIAPMGYFPWTPSFTNMSFVDLPDPVSGHSDLLPTLGVLVGTRGLSCLPHVPLPLTHSSDCLCSGVCNLMRRCPIHLLPYGYGARRLPHIYAANRMRSDRWPQRIRCYRMSSAESGLWCWDATPQASDDRPVQCRGQSWPLSFFTKVRSRQVKVILVLKS